MLIFVLIISLANSIMVSEVKSCKTNSIPCWCLWPSTTELNIIFDVRVNEIYYGYFNEHLPYVNSGQGDMPELFKDYLKNIDINNLSNSLQLFIFKMSHFAKHLQGEKSEDVLYVSGSRCHIYPIDNETLKGEMLSPWMNDKSLLIDKYDARCWLSDLSCFDDFKSDILEDLDNEELCDKERYLDLHEKLSEINENFDEKEEDNSNRSGMYSSVKYSYDEETEFKQVEIVNYSSDQEEDHDIPYQLPPDLKVPDTIELPKTEKQAAKIEKTATFIASHGIQMEILLKTKQGNNKKFQFLSFDDNLNPFYKFLLDKIKNAEYVPAKRQLVHLTKSENSDSPILDSTLIFPKIDISNTAYFKLINKYRNADMNDKTDSPSHEKSVDSDDSGQMKTDPKDCVNAAIPSTEIVEDEKEKLYKSLYEQYYTYYYNYYYQLHNNSPMLQDSNTLQIQEDSKSLAINAAAYAAKAGVEQYQKDQDESIRIDKMKQEKIERKKQLCITIKYVDYIIEHGSEFEYAIMSQSDKLKFLDPDNQNHSFYQHYLTRAKKAANKATDPQHESASLVVNHYPKWEDYLKKLPTGNIQSAPKLVVESPKSRIIVNATEQRLIGLADHISSLLNAEEIGRRKYMSQHPQPSLSTLPMVTTTSVVDSTNVQATRKRKATEFLAKINKKREITSDQHQYHSHLKSAQKRSKKRKSK